MSDPPLHNRGNFLDSVVELDRRLLDYIAGLDTEINELVDGSVRNNVNLRNVEFKTVLFAFRTFSLLKLHWMMLHYQLKINNYWLIPFNLLAISKR